MKSFINYLIMFLSKRIVNLILINFLALNFLFSEVGTGQKLTDIDISVNFENEKLTDVFYEIENKTSFKFDYELKTLRKKEKFNFSSNGINLRSLLEKLALAYKLKFNQYGNNIVIGTDQNLGNGPIVEMQGITIEGGIFDENDQPLPVATVMEKGTNNGTTTNFDGAFSLIVSEGSTLVVSYIGYQTQELEIRNTRSFKIKLVPSTGQLDEVVVVGYGQQQKINLTGAVASIDSDVIDEGKFLNLPSLLQGRLPGLQITQNSGAPGAEGINLQIRGVGTYSGAGANPLVIIDGVAGGDINSLNPETIESVSILKDAASAAIYGARAANGVILITTKTGEKSGKIAINISSNTAFHSPTQIPDLIWNSVEYMEMFNQALENMGNGGNLFTEEEIDLYRNPTDPKQYPNVNWLDELFDTRVVTNQSLSLQGNSGKTGYFGQIAYLHQPGTFLGYNMDRTTMQFNMDSQISKVVEFGIKTGLVLKNRTTQNGDDGAGVDPLLSTIAHDPTYAPVLPDGSGRYSQGGFRAGNKNTYMSAKEVLAHIKGQDYRLQAYLKLTPIPSIGIQGNIAVAGGLSETKFMEAKVPTYNFITGEYVRDYGTNNFSQNLNRNNLTTVNLYGNYKEAFGNFDLDFVLGTSYESYWDSSIGGTRLNYISSALTELNAGPEEGQTNSGSSREWALLSYFGRMSVNYKQKYLLELNARYDGSSRFSKENRWGFFPSISAGWNVAREDFFDVSWIDEFKFRGSWGSLGNQDIGYYPYQSLLSISGGYPFDNSLTPGVMKTALNNQDISWETTTIADLGIDAQFFKGKLNLTFDYFNKTTADILRRADIPVEIGYTSPIINDGEMVNKGFELGISTKNAFENDFSYTVGGTISMYRNNLKKYGSVTYGGNYINEEGHPFQTYYLWEVQGIFQDEGEIETAAVQANNPGPGDLRYVDQNSDGNIDSDDKIYFDGRHPDFEYSFNIGLNYKNFSLNTFFYGVEGRQFYTGQWGYEPFRQGSPPPVKWRNAWTPENTDTTVPRLYSGGTKATSEPSNYWLEDASYLRLKSMDIGYDFSKELISRIGLDGLRIYLSGQNLFTITDFSGFDPERVGDSVRGGVRYPQNKVYSLGVNIKI